MYPVPRCVGLLRGLHDRGVHPTDRVVRAVGGDLYPGGHPTGDVRRGGHHGVRADVDPDHVSAARYDGVELGVGPTAAGELADPSHQLPFLEPFDQLGGGDLGKPGELSQLRSGQRPALEKQLERGAVIDRAEQARRSGLAGLTHSGNGP